MKDHLLHGPKDLGSFAPENETSRHFERIQNQNQNLEAKKLYLSTL